MSTRTKRPAPKKAAPAAKAPKAAPRAASETVGLEEIKGLIALVARESFAEFEFEAGGMSFRIRKEGAVALVAPAAAPVVLGSPVAHVPAQSAPAPAPAPATPAPAAPAAPAEDPTLHYLTSPIVGTFYRASNPNAPSFVQVGDRVKPGQTLCIVEAMKLMNEIECDVAGEVVKILVENGQPVEYGERLFAIRVG
ncbi:MAG TPA: acetyl-CoA carboxylase biotin carboxyl carrier protein [Holophagaceae bacterium]|nr:acetyl-CoA carboxylase biotin carboxyl carrier protein [Holophagaceae bacterium]